MRSAGDSMARVSVHVGSDWFIHLSAYEARTPILDVDAGDVAVSFTLVSREPVTDSALEFARRLARSAAAFAAEVERIHAMQTGGKKPSDVAGAAA